MKSRKPSVAVLVGLLFAALLLGGAACGDATEEAAPAAPSPAATAPTQTAALTPEPTAPPAPTPAPEPTPTPTAIPTRTPTPAPDSRPTEYVVRPGDTLRSIAERFGISIECLAEANQVEDSDGMLPSGLPIRIPAPDECAADGPATPAPTSTLTATPEPCPTAVEAVYLRGLGNAVSGIDEATFNLQRLFIRLENDPQIVFTDRFIREFAAVAAVAKDEAQKILDLTPPKSILTSSGFHHTATSLARATIYSMKHFSDGFDRLDIGEFEQGVYMLESLEYDLPLVRDGIDGFCE